MDNSEINSAPISSSPIEDNSKSQVSPTSTILEVYPTPTESFEAVLEKGEDEDILFGTTFDPDQELQQLKTLPLKERREAVEVYKKKLLVQMGGYADLQNDLTFFMRYDATQTAASLREIYREKKIRYGFPDSTDSRVYEAIDRIMQLKALVHTTFAESQDPIRLCEKLMGFKPKGSVVVKPGIITLNFIFSDAEDVGRSYSGNKKYTEQEFTKTGKKIAGFFQLRDSSLPLIIGLNNCDTDSPFYVHEEQHAIYTVLKDYIEKPYLVGNSRNFIGEGIDRDTKEKWLVSFFEKHKRNSLQRVKDEILAYKKGNNFTDESIMKLLKTPRSAGGLYDYTSEVRKAMTEAYVTQSAETQTLMWKLMQRILVNEYQEDIVKAINAFNKLQSAGFTNEQCIHMLAVIPVIQWPKVAIRMNEYVNQVQNPPASPEMLQMLVKRYSDNGDNKTKRANKSEAQAKMKTEKEQIDAIQRTLEQYSKPKAA